MSPSVFFIHHMEAHILLGEGCPLAVSSIDCYLCSLAGAYRMARNASLSRTGSGERSLWPGRPWGYAAPCCDPIATKSQYDEQFSSDEYLIAILGLAKETTAFSIGTPTAFQIGINIPRIPPCHFVDRKPLMFSGVPLWRGPSLAHISLQRHIQRDKRPRHGRDCVKWPIDFRHVCGARVAEDINCDAVLQPPSDVAHPCHVVNPAGRAALILFI